MVSREVERMVENRESGGKRGCVYTPVYHPPASFQDYRRRIPSFFCPVPNSLNQSRTINSLFAEYLTYNNHNIHRNIQYISIHQSSGFRFIIQLKTLLVT